MGLGPGKGNFNLLCRRLLPAGAVCQSHPFPSLFGGARTGHGGWELQGLLRLFQALPSHPLPAARRGSSTAAQWNGITRGGDPSEMLKQVRNEEALVEIQRVASCI